MKRRTFLKASLFFTGTAMLIPAFAEEKPFEIDEAKELAIFQKTFLEYGGGKALDGSSMINLIIPEKPESAAAVPVEIEINHPMEEGNYISKITVLSELNRIKHIITAHYTPANGLAYLFVNIKLGMTQNVHILAETNGGKIYTKKQKISVALSGCA